jgi:hypothetical protein
LGVARAMVVGTGLVAAVARKRNCAKAVTKFKPSVCVAHCSGVRVLCVWPKGVAASYLEVAFARKPQGDVSAVEWAMHAASDVNSVLCCQGGLSGGGGLCSSRLAKHPRLPQGSTEKGMRVRCA